jgi:hypothetical protein
VQGNINAQATFAINTYTLTYTTDGNGTISGTATQNNVAYGSSGTSVTAVPNTGYHFVKWADTNSTSPTRTDANVQGDINAQATFAINMYTLTYTTDGNGTISGTATQNNVAYGSSGTSVTAMPSPGYNFDHWSDSVTTAARQDSNVTTDVSVEAIFVPETQLVFTISPTSVTAGSGSTAAEVSIEDASNRVVASDDATQISIVDSVCGTILATGTVNAGVAQFSNLTFVTVANSRHLHAISSPVLTSADSGDFDVLVNSDWLFRSGFETCVP